MKTPKYCLNTHTNLIIRSQIMNSHHERTATPLENDTIHLANCQPTRDDLADAEQPRSNSFSLSHYSPQTTLAKEAHNASSQTYISKRLRNWPRKQRPQTAPQRQ